MQAVTRVNAEQASKRVTWEPTRLSYGEGRCWRDGTERQSPAGPTGVLATACMTRKSTGTREAHAVRGVTLNRHPARGRPGR